MDEETFRELSLAFASGTLEGHELESFLAALADADEKRLLIYVEAAALAHDLALKPPAEPSEGLKTRLMAAAGRQDAAQDASLSAPSHSASRNGHSAGSRTSGQSSPVRSGRPRPPRRFLRSLVAGVGIAIAVLVLGAGVLFYAFRLQGTLGNKEAALEVSRNRITVLEDSLERREALLEVLLSHNLQVVVMQGREKVPAGYGKMIWCPKRRCGILHVANLPPVPGGHEYQLWFQHADGRPPVNGGLFSVKKTTWDGDLFRVQGMAEVERSRLQGFMVTLEPEGGSRTPSGDPYLSGSTSM